jgi:hypothetical protein
LFLNLAAMPGFTIEHLTHERLLDAWPIVRSSGGYARADWWLAHAACLIGDGGGVLAVRAADGAVHGVAIYRLGRDRSFNKVLSVQSIITFELRRRAPARRTLCDALDELSLKLDCNGVEMRDRLRPKPSMAFF